MNKCYPIISVIVIYQAFYLWFFQDLCSFAYYVKESIVTVMPYIWFIGLIFGIGATMLVMCIYKKYSK